VHLWPSLLFLSSRPQADPSVERITLDNRSLDIYIVPMRKIELMAPARTAEIGMAAINCGADAVYLGAARFGAREDAGNSIQDIARLTAYAHQYYARVYVTLNTILHDKELPAAQQLISQLYQAEITA
jgi:23S rRNA 5-hydroxycytidine C2501 synthase